MGGAAAVRPGAPAQPVRPPLSGLGQEIERARALMAQSRRLVAESRSLRLEISRLAASWLRRGSLGCLHQL